jgi:hypothetical protein
MIDYVRLKTKTDKIPYVAHSQGTSLMFAALAEDFGQLDQKISIFVALAPITHLIGSHNSLIKQVSKSIPVVKNIMDKLNIHELFG